MEATKCCFVRSHRFSGIGLILLGTMMIVDRDRMIFEAKF